MIPFLESDYSSLDSSDIDFTEYGDPESEDSIIFDEKTMNQFAIILRILVTSG